MADDDTPLPQSQRAELLKRLASLEDDKSRAVSWGELRTEWGARKL